MSNNIFKDSLSSQKNSIGTSFWQSPLWGKILSQTHQAETFWHTYNHQTWLLERRKIFGNSTALYALGVPAVSLTSDNITHLRTVTKKSDLFLQIEPLGPVSQKEIPLTPAPFRRFIEPKTAILGLKDQTEQTLLQSFAEKGRYNIRVAERRGLTTCWVRGDDVSTFDLPSKPYAGKKTYAEVFFQLLEETTERDNFSHNALPYYQTFLRILESHNAGGLLLSLKDGVIHAAGIFVYWDHHALYYYGASSNQIEIRRDHGTYLLQWEAIKEALRRGCTDYDFLGISSREGDKLAGVTTFKMRFAPDKVQLPPERIITLRPVTLKFLQCISRIRKIFR